MARMGMDVDAVESIARAIQGDADRLGQLTANFDVLVRKLPGLWAGADATRFVQDWWPQHRKTLSAVQESVRGLGQSALNNAAEQRQASGTGGGGTAATTAPPDSTGPAGVAPTPTVAPTGVPAAVVAAWGSSVDKQHIDVDGRWGAQCVDLVNHYLKTVFPKASPFAIMPCDYARQAFDNASVTYFDKIPVAGPPQIGDIACMGAFGTNSSGHVAVVTRVDSGGIYVMEQDGNHPDGTAFGAYLSPVEMSGLQGFLRPKV